MPETKPVADTKPTAPTEIQSLRAQLADLRAQLAAARSGRVNAPAQQFVLAEGNRAELETYGVTNINGVRMTREQVEAKLGSDQRAVDLGDAEPADGAVPAVERTAVRGVDFVYPSVAPGQIDPDVAGLPGINGPAA